MNKRMFRSTMELEDGRTLQYSIVYDHSPATHNDPEEWVDYEPVYEIDGKSSSREEFLGILTAAEFAQFVDDATEDRNWRLDGPDAEPDIQ